MADKINLIIDGKQISVDAGTSILDAAKQNGIYIPTLCHDDIVKVYGACGLCVVEGEGMPKLMRSCSQKAAEGMVINTSSQRVVQARKVALELIMSAHEGDCKAPCSLACPAGTDCQGYVGLIANGEYDEALKLIKEKIPMPASIGRVCPHPCEKACRRGLVEEPINIAGLKAFAADIDLKSENQYIPQMEKETGKKVNIIGGGPAGLTAAYFLRLKGHDVNIYDMMPNMGGMLRYGIPEYRLPKKVVDKEVELIQNLGVKMHNNVKLGKDISIDELRKNSDALVLAVGAWKSSPMRVQGEDSQGVYGGIDFLRNVVLGNKVEIGEKVAVCGGGNTAMDACRTAVRLGAKEVYIIYRRTRNEMPAEDIEIKEAEEEGVVFKFLTNPAEILSKDGKVCGIKLQKMMLGEPDASGRRKPVEIEGEFEEIELDSVIMAIGQKLDSFGLDNIEMTSRNNILADENSFRTNLDGVFAIGDATNKGASIAIEAVGEGGRAAIAIDAYLNGIDINIRKPYYSERNVTAETLKDKEKIAREIVPQLEADERKDNFTEVVKGYSCEQAEKEAKRCLECGCREYFKCKLLNIANLYDIDPDRFAGEKPTNYDGKDANEFIVRNTDKCILCGLCVRSCKEVMNISAIGLLSRGFKTDVSPAFKLPLNETDCNNCGLCVKLCPTGALTERNTMDKQVPLNEKYVDTTCNVCEKNCSITLAYYGNKIIRVIPNDETSRNCHLGREKLIEEVIKLK
ncbi:MAG: FAD-dependent oxidoreductase [Clostridia bacterium]|nr:FAD-dependent oxidoreductase [Clostridia bacterium]